MSWGFPQIVQDHTMTAFQKDTAFSSDNETASISFPTTSGDITGSVFGSSFPMISQTSEKTTFMSSVRFQNENEHFSFSYPFMSVGNSWMPSMSFM
jgi:hypothetical protein